MNPLKLVAYSVERLIGKVLEHKKVLVTEVKSGHTYTRRVSHTKLQKLIMDPKVKSVKFP